VDIYQDCKTKEGRGNKDAKLMMIYEGPEFKSEDVIKQICKETKVRGNEIYLTPLKKGFPKGVDRLEVKERMIAEIAEINPEMIWVIGDFPLEVLDIKMPMSFGFAMYFPFLQDDFFVYLMPNRKQISTMPEDVRKEFWRRMKMFREEWNNSRKIKSSRRADKEMVKQFAGRKGYKYDKQLKSDKTYYVMFSNKLETHVFVLPTGAIKEDFKNNIPFGLKFTQEQVGNMSPKTRDLIAEMMDKFNGDLIKVDEEITKRKVFQDE